MYVIGWNTRLQGKRDPQNGLWLPNKWYFGRWSDDLKDTRRFETRHSAEEYMSQETLSSACTVLHIDEVPTILALAAPMAYVLAWKPARPRCKS